MELIITRQAEKDLASLDKATRARIEEALDRFVENPKAADIKKLEGKKDEWRLRVGNYRVRMKFIDGMVLVYALRILHRNEAYRS